MPVHLIVVAGLVARAVAAAITAYEVYQFGQGIYDKQADFRKELEKAKSELKSVLKDLQQELNQKTIFKSECAYLEHEQKNDPQGRSTSSAKGRGASQDFKEYIQQKIPYRKVISDICDKANANGMPQLQKKKGVKVKDLAASKAKIIAEWTGVLISEIYDMELDDAFIVAQLRQLAASIMFEFMDEVLAWQSPLKTEVCFGAKYEDPKASAVPPTRLLRTAMMSANPFYPSPYHNQKGSISADLIIPETRLQPVSKTNLFAIIEIKFQNDRLKKQQFSSYERLLDEAQKAKHTKYGTGNNHSTKGLVKGGCISLFRYPEDKAVEKDKSEQHNKKSSSSRGK